MPNHPEMPKNKKFCKDVTRDTLDLTGDFSKGQIDMTLKKAFNEQVKKSQSHSWTENYFKKVSNL